MKKETKMTKPKEEKMRYKPKEKILEELEKAIL